MTRAFLPVSALLLSFALAPLYFRGVRRSSALYLAGRPRTALLLTGLRLALVVGMGLVSARLGGDVLVGALAGFLAARTGALRADGTP